MRSLMDWTSVPGYNEDDPSHEVVERYARLSPFELRALRDRLRSMAEKADEEQPENPLQANDPFEGFEGHVAARHCRRLARMCERILNWHPEAAEWHWNQIVANATLRGHAKAVQGALQNYPDEDTPTKILRTASKYYGYDPEAHTEAIEQYRKDKWEEESFPHVSDWRAWTKTLWDGYDEEATHQRIGTRYREVGWGGASGGRDELEKLTEAILWATETGSEETDKPELQITING